MTFAHLFIDISQNILNLWMRLIFPKTRHLGFQFEHKNETISIRIDEDMIFLNLALQPIIVVMGKPNFACSSLPPISKFNAPNFPKGYKMRSRFMIHCQPSLNDILFIFSPPLLHSKTIQKPHLFSSLEFWWSRVVLSYLGLLKT